MFLKNSVRQIQRSYSSYADVREQCRRFAKDQLQPVASQLDRSASYPTKQIASLGKLGYMGVTVPSKYGGSGLDMRSLAVAVEELSRGCASTGAIVSIHNILYADLLSTFGSDAQRNTFLMPYTSGIPGAFALSEPEAGSDVANISTTATLKGSDYVLNGLKSWVTSAYQSEVAVIFATVDKSAKRRGITAFLVPLNAAGVQLCEPEKKLGIRATSTCEISLTDVKIPKENVVGDVGGGFKIAMHQLNRARVGIASQALGIAQAALDAAVDYAQQRRVFGQPLINLQAVELRLARMATQVEASRLLITEAARRCDEQTDNIKNCAMAKLMASETATFCAHQCIQILGGIGYTEHMPAERHYRDARITEIYGGVSDIQMLIIAEQLIKETNAKAQ